MSKEVDIIIPVYKAHDTLFNCLASIAVQSAAPKIQVTLVNDQCPEGDYQEIIDVFKGRLDIQELFMETNSGPGDARQYGIEHTNSPFIFFVDADDMLMGPRAIEWMYTELATNEDAWLIMGHAVEEMADGGWVPLPMPNSIWIFGKGYRRSIIEKYGVHFKPGSRSNEDVGFNVMLTLLSSAHDEAVRALNKTVYLWRYKESSITRVDDSLYTYMDGPVGWVDNLIYAYQTVLNMDDDVEISVEQLHNMLTGWCAESWVMYNNIYRWHPELCERNWQVFKRLYNETIRPHVDNITKEEWDAGLQSVSDQGMNVIEKFIPFKEFMIAMHDDIEFLDIDKYKEPNAS